MSTSAELQKLDGSAGWLTCSS